MAHETSTPKIRTMLIVAAFSAMSLAIFDQIFKSYFHMMMEEEEAEKVLTVPTTQLTALRAAEQQRLTSATLPIDRAMKELATRGREDPALKDLAKTDITPQPSNDNGAQVGWGLAAKSAAPAAPAPPAPTDHMAPGDHGAMAGDAGATSAGDAGAPAPNAVKDAGWGLAPPHAPPRVPAPEAGTN